jgi:hypothetical protein
VQRDSNLVEEKRNHGRLIPLSRKWYQTFHRKWLYYNPAPRVNLGRLLQLTMILERMMSTFTNLDLSFELLHLETVFLRRRDSIVDAASGIEINPLAIE